MEKLIYVSTDPVARTLRMDRALFDAPSEVESAVLYTLDLSHSPSSPPPTCVLTCWLACVDRRGPIERFLSRSEARFHAYVCTESSLLRGAMAEVTRGTVEFLQKPHSLGRDAWLDSLERSQEGMEHGLSIARNLVTRALTSDAPPLDIMREGVGTEAKSEAEVGGERLSQLGLFTPGRSFVGERLTLRRGRFSA